MCGIAGFVLNEINPEAGDWITGMTQRLYHRGPDDGGAVVFGMNGSPIMTRRLGRPGETVDWGYIPVKVALGARRLSIIDLSPAGHQPMSSADGRVWIVYNGEIYNHEALRRELVERGMPFVGQSDTEVFLAAYRAWGTDCFARYDGMWAAAILDWSAGKMILSRDRFGIKPLYVARFKRGMAFASEIKSILTLPTIGGDVNEAMLRDFLLEGRVDHTEATFFENIWAAPPGCFIELNLRARGVVHTGGVVRRYWRPAVARTLSSKAPDEIKAMLTDAVRSHLRSDVLVGSCLSGGVDSSAIVCLIDKLSRESADALENSQWSQHTFTASLPGTSVDETKYAEAVVEACQGLRSSIVTPTAEQFVRDVGALVWHQEQPFGSPSIYLQWEVMRLARESGVKVLLDGQGGDELFCGYEGQIPPYLAHLLLRGRWVRFWKEYAAARSEYFRDGSLVGHIAAHILPRGLRTSLRRSAKLRRMNWLSGDLASAEEPEGLCTALKLTPTEDVEAADGSDRFERFLWSLIVRESLPSLFRFEDRNSMAFSIEARVPFLDHRLVERAMGLPVELKIRDGRLKVVLREAMKGIVPETVLARRDKIGFSAPTETWMKTGLREWWVELLTSKSFQYRGCFEMKGVRDAIERFQSGDMSVTNDLWRMAIVEQWARQFLDHEGID